MVRYDRSYTLQPNTKNPDRMSGFFITKNLIRIIRIMLILEKMHNHFLPYIRENSLSFKYLLESLFSSYSSSRISAVTTGSN